jgi:hypothetical protein
MSLYHKYLFQHYNDIPMFGKISASFLRKSTRRRACTPLSVHGAALDLKDIDHRLNKEHECTLLRLPRTMASTVIFSYFIRPTELTADNGAFYVRKKGYWLPKKELEGPIHACDKEQMARPSV